MKGVSEGCVQARASLIGGETAIMPDLYQKGDYDLAGFCVGVVERDHLIDGKAISPDDVVIGVASTGIHSNGFSLVRKIVFEAAKADLSMPFGDAGTLGDTLLAPTAIYAGAVRRVLSHYKVKNVVHGIAHITGGGLAENVERILPSSVDIQIDAASWEHPPVFDWLREKGGVDTQEMYRVFNMGVGLALIVSPFYAESIARMIQQSGYSCWTIGHVHTGSGRVQVTNM